MYVYRATVLRIVDGDTVHARVDLGFDVRMDMKVRLFGINAPEMGTPEGRSARAHLIALLWGPDGDDPILTPMVLTTVKDRTEKYGRYLGTLWHEGEYPDHPSINAQMVADGYAVEASYG